MTRLFSSGYTVAILTTLAQLEEVQAAITAVMSGQSYQIGDIRFTKANLTELSNREETLKARYYRENRNSGVRTRPNFSQGI